MSDAELRTMILNFRVSDLVVLLAFAGRNKSGKKQELQSRALDLLKLNTHAVRHKIQELHNRRYNNQLVARPNNFEIQDRSQNDRAAQHYDGHINNSYAPPHYNSNAAPINHHPNSGYPVSKSYLPPPPLSSTNSATHYPSYVDVKFKDLPFFDVLYEIQRPANLVNSMSDRYQETALGFTLTPQQANDVALSRNASGQFDCQILLRFCLLDSSCEQEDNFPPSICIKVNGKLVPLPNPIPTNRPGVEPKRPSKPVNITSFTKLSPTVSNNVSISWSATYGRSYVFALYVARQLTSDNLLYRLKSAGVRNPEVTTALIREKLQEGQDCDIATTSLQGSLLCPLGKVRMELPCRATTCSHIQCFDASLYLQMNEKKPKWICPVCDKPALFKTLAIDGLFMDIATKVPSNCNEVQFNDDGSWTAIAPKKEPKEAPKKETAVVEDSSEKKPKTVVEIVDISDEESDSESWNDLIPKDIARKISCTTPEPTSPPLVFLSPDIPVVTASLQPPFSSNPYPQSLQAVSNIMTDVSDPLCILPDTPIPSTSSTSASLTIPPYPQIPYLDSAYVPYSEPLVEINESQSVASGYTNFDFYDLLNNTIDIDSEKESEQTAPPDVISLE